MFWLKNKKNNFQFHTLIWGPERRLIYHCLSLDMIPGIIQIECLFVLMLYTPVNNFFSHVGTISCLPGLNQRIKCLAQGRNTVTLVSLKLASLNSNSILMFIQIETIYCFCETLCPKLYAFKKAGAFFIIRAITAFFSDFLFKLI